MPRGLSEADVRKYKQRGVLFPVQLHPSGGAEHAEVKAGYDELERERGLSAQGFSKADHLSLIDLHFGKQWLWDLATYPPLLDVVESLIGPDVLLLSTHIFCKYGPSSHRVDWHQDCLNWGLDRTDDVITAWYAVDPSDASVGAMEVIPGTHAAGLVAHGKSGATGNLLASNQALAVTSAELGRKEVVALSPGQISLHHGRLYHSSPPNLAARRRCGITLRFCPPYVRQVQASNVGTKWKALRVRGLDECGNYGDTSPEARLREFVCGTVRARAHRPKL
eukprot:TRINITY_DN71030_c0_g1_i1.p1 TRINITY_DN71030_c0_g1~~TRINITY_DN71030_c0_g1_i1.p1  ORF type:complete len:305 (+),score=84.34 TRINITY_DN71030_c0_g1_i1:80-916(+)